MKPSRYLRCFGEGDIKLLYSSFSGALARVPAQVATLLTAGDMTRLPDDMLAQLHKGRFVVPKNLDEIVLVQTMSRCLRFNSSTLVLTMVPTLQCNMRCQYCYQSPNPATMTDEVASRIIDMLHGQIDRVRSLYVIWFGGEPLLAADVIDRLSDGIIRACEEHHVSYGSAMITNGTLLQRHLDRLSRWRVRHLQLTIDGPAHVHNERKPYKTGGPTYDAIVASLKASAPIVPVVVRVNVDRDNAEAVPELLSYLCNDPACNPADVYFAPVKEINHLCQSVSESCLYGKEYAEVEVDLAQTAMEMGFRSGRYPRPNLGICGAVSLNSYVIDPSGDIYRCWNHVGSGEGKVGSVTQNGDILAASLPWLNYDPLVDEECRQCDILPVCMGGCPYERMNQFRETCLPYKHNIETMLRLKAEELLKRRQADAAVQV